MKIQQIAIFLENKPGHIRRICRTLADAGISIRTLSLADTQQYGILRLVVEEWEKARSALEAAGYVVKIIEVLAVEVPDKPGGLAGILDIIGDAGVNIEYMYAFTSRSNETAIMVFRFDDPNRAIDVLQKAGVTVLGHIDLFARSAFK